SGCGGNLTGLSYGVFTSPEFPNRYLQNQTCSWYISPHRTSYFKFDEVSAGLDCDTSYVAVYQGTLDTDPLISTYCNVANVSPRQFSSSIMVQYISTGNGTAPVFKFTFAPTMNELL
ncbi:cubilin, partial [Biomphalaria glabrata]